MNEEEWLTTSDLRAMLKLLEGRASERKLRLFACACCRLLWDHLETGLMTEAVETGERVADGLLTWEEAQPYVTQLYSLVTSVNPETRQKWLVGRSVESMAAWGGAIMSIGADCALLNLATKSEHTNYGRVSAATSSRQPPLLRDIFGSPFRPVAPEPSWLTPRVAERARVAYEDRILPSGELHPTLLAVLAGALEEAGAEGELLTHLRGSGPHVRGCWAVDACLGKS